MSQNDRGARHEWYIWCLTKKNTIGMQQGGLRSGNRLKRSGTHVFWAAPKNDKERSLPLLKPLCPYTSFYSIYPLTLPPSRAAQACGGYGDGDVQQLQCMQRRLNFINHCIGVLGSGHHDLYDDAYSTTCRDCLVVEWRNGRQRDANLIIVTL